MQVDNKEIFLNNACLIFLVVIRSMNAKKSINLVQLEDEVSMDTSKELFKFVEL